MSRTGAQEREYSVRVLERVRDVPRETWDALARAGDDGSPFLEHTWLDGLEQTGCVGPESGWLPAHLTLWRGEKLVAAAPSYVKGNSEGEFVFDWGWAEAAERMGIRYYPKVVLAVPFTPATGERVLVAPGEDRAEATRVVAAAVREWCGRFEGSGVHVLFPPEDEATHWEGSGYLLREGMQLHWRRDGATCFEDYLGRFDSKHRNQMKRELRRVREAGITVETLPPEGHTREIARAMHGFYSSTVDKHGPWGRHYLNERFFDWLVDHFKDRLAWVIARDERTGKPIGGAFNVAKGKRMYGRYWGTPSDVPNLHFVLCYYEGIRWCIERGIDVFEGGAGRDEHKRSRGFEPTMTRSVHWLADGRMRRALGPWLEHERRRIRSFLTEP